MEEVFTFWFSYCKSDDWVTLDDGLYRKMVWFSKVLSIRNSQRASKQPRILTTSNALTKGQQLKRMDSYLRNYLGIFRFKWHEGRLTKLCDLFLLFAIGYKEMVQNRSRTEQQYLSGFLSMPQVCESANRNLCQNCSSSSSLPKCLP